MERGETVIGHWINRAEKAEAALAAKDAALAECVAMLECLSKGLNTIHGDWGASPNSRRLADDIRAFLAKHRPEEGADNADS